MKTQACFHIIEELGCRGFYRPILWRFPFNCACSQPRARDGCNLPRPNPCFSFGKGQGAGLLDRSYSSVLKPLHTI